MTMSAYLENIKQIVDNLTAVGEPLEDQTVTHFVVNGLGLNFEPFAQTVTGQVESFAQTVTGQGRDQTNQNGRGSGLSQTNRGITSNRTLRQICNKRGHFAIQCPNRFNLSYQPSPTPHAHSVQVDNHSDAAWYIDSGTSHYITSDSSLLTDSGSYTSLDQVMIGNGSGLPISTIGTYRLKQSLPL
ncbi:hypothetical protein H6P81_003364 [Aristolochia fimbriata]|uniref:Uncharacterized protein n=1 Tax=Aristolochia fimbriata TaxID=158543 RepID=A0AAV7FDF7_ARIFI|nr:hypothetical protein H6P81_003364 [Aristolochia fimbriata]